MIVVLERGTVILFLPSRFVSDHLFRFSFFFFMFVQNRDINPLAKEVQRALQEMGREELFYQAPDIENGDTSTMESLIQSSDDLLRESRSILADTEHIGTSTIQQMGRQREQLQNANQALQAVTATAQRAKQLLGSMSRKALQSKLGLYFMIVVLGAANIYVLYLIYKKTSSHSTTRQ